MKIDPIDFLINKKIKKKKFYLISGNEITLMKKVCDVVIDNIRTKINIKIEKVKNLKQIIPDISLFDEKIVYILSDASNVDNETLEEISKQNQTYIFVIENTPKIKKIKNIFFKRKDCYVSDCYELTRDAKIKIMNNWLKHNNISIEKEAYWLLVENVDDKYGLLEKELEKLLNLSENEIGIDKIKKIVSKNTAGTEKVFFKINRSYEYLVNLYNKKVTNEKDVYELFFYIKQMSILFLNNLTEEDFANNIPKYLFREKNFLLEIFKKLTSDKKKLILILLYDTEKNLRNKSLLSTEIGLRFLLKFRKVIIS